MSLIGKFHPLLVHFPIALVLAAAAAELVVVATSRQALRTIAVANIRAGAALGIVTAFTGWLFASSPLVDASPSLEMHRVGRHRRDLDHDERHPQRHAD